MCWPLGENSQWNVEGTRSVLEAACVAGLRFELSLVADLVGEAAIEDPVASGILAEVELGVGAFRHSLTREAFYHDIPWGRRRALHPGSDAGSGQAGFHSDSSREGGVRAHRNHEARAA